MAKLKRIGSKSQKVLIQEEKIGSRAAKLRKADFAEDEDEERDFEQQSDTNNSTRMMNAEKPLLSFNPRQNQESRASGKAS